MMKTVAFYKGEFVDLEVPKPSPGEKDVLVRVKAISVNPVDVKQRIAAASKPQSEPIILGWDVAGVVEHAGADSHCLLPAMRCSIPEALCVLAATANITLWMNGL
jgi:NADPH:quinone reductase-like Zn-dependent oxidoreductase